MTDETEQTDDHLALIARANGKAPADRHDVTQNVRVKSDVDARGNTVSTPILALMMAASVIGLVFGVLGFYSGNAADRHAGEIAGQLELVRTDAAMARTADDKANQARMEFRLAQEDLIMLRAAVKAHGIHVDTAQDHD